MAASVSPWTKSPKADAAVTASADLERGRVVEAGDLAAAGIALPPRYGGGTWAGKLLRAVEVQQRLHLLQHGVGGGGMVGGAKQQAGARLAASV